MTRMEIKNRISKILDTESLKKKVKFQFNWDAEWLDSCIEEYIKFLTLKIVKNDLHSNNYGCGWYIDKVWLYHSSIYKEYVMDCNWICHEVIDYQSYNDSNFKNSLEAYEELFFCKPNDIWTFTVDQQSKSVRMPMVPFTLEERSQSNILAKKISYPIYATEYKISKKTIDLIKVIFELQKEVVVFKVHRYESLKRLFKSFCKKRLIPLESVEFKFNTKIVTIDDKLHDICSQTGKKKINFKVDMKKQQQYQTLTPPINPKSTISKID